MKTFQTINSQQTKNIGKLLTKELSGGEVICLSGDLGAGKTTFTQGLLEGLGLEGPYTSPTFAILKEYKIQNSEKELFNNQCSTINKIYHIDAYRIEEKDLLELGWQDFAEKENCIVIIEWAERVKNIIPENALWINFEWINENTRKIELSQK
ncbi:MAG: hypothetical protein ACD_11C00116G0001 [uncultured bacterium]|nr:MAG: hypothetical protein ACD_11C00116G0001 [uncultured bacterium]HBR71256.1 tRNA (adenosine(37)-N6)-threonylcarbamoyltransferase complex ATPase subunit type 1 TsaE [Candidatus Moranbacteria bacterium]